MRRASSPYVLWDGVDGNRAAPKGPRVKGTNSVTITSLSTLTNVVTVVTATAHGLVAGESVTLAGIVTTLPATTDFNGVKTVASVADSTHFTFAQTSTAEAATGGTATWTGQGVWSSGNSDDLMTFLFSGTLTTVTPSIYVYDSIAKVWCLVAAASAITGNEALADVPTAGARFGYLALGSVTASDLNVNAIQQQNK